VTSSRATGNNEPAADRSHDSSASDTPRRATTRASGGDVPRPEHGRTPWKAPAGADSRERAPGLESTQWWEPRWQPAYHGTPPAPPKNSATEAIYGQASRPDATGRPVDPPSPAASPDAGTPGTGIGQAELSDSATDPHLGSRYGSAELSIIRGSGNGQAATALAVRTAVKGTDPELTPPKRPRRAHVGRRVATWVGVVTAVLLLGGAGVLVIALAARHTSSPPASVPPAPTTVPGNGAPPVIPAPPATTPPPPVPAPTNAAPARPAPSHTVSSPRQQAPARTRPAQVGSQGTTGAEAGNSTAAETARPTERAEATESTTPAESSAPIERDESTGTAEPTEGEGPSDSSPETEHPDRDEQRSPREAHPKRRNEGRPSSSEPDDGDSSSGLLGILDALEPALPGLG
jgi:hypothetical protein